MDEPTSALAVAEVEAVLALINRAKTRGVSVVLITQRLQDLFRVCNRIAVMYESTKVAERRIAETDLTDIVRLIVGDTHPAEQAGVRRDDLFPTTRCIAPRRLSGAERAGAVDCRVLPGLCHVLFADQPCLLFGWKSAEHAAPVGPDPDLGSRDDLCHHDGGIGLSVGSTVAIVNALAAVLMEMGIPWPLVVLLLLGVGAQIGAVQGRFVAHEGIPSFVVTLAGLPILRGAALVMTQGCSIPIPIQVWSIQIGRGWFLGIPFPAVLAVVAAALGFFALGSRRFGRHIVAIGANAGVARRAGIAVKQRLVMVYVLTGDAAAVAGIVIAARLGFGSSNAAVGFEIDVIAAVVPGGTSLMGGKGTIAGTMLGALTIAVIGSGLILSHVSPLYTQIVTGLIILVAIWLTRRVFARLAAPVSKS